MSRCAHCGITRTEGRHVCWQALLDWFNIKREENAMSLTTEWTVPDALAPFYLELEAMGFVNRTAPTPDEWNHPAGYQVRLSHVARETRIRFRNTPPEPPERIAGIDAQARYDRTFPWSARVHTQRCSLEEFRSWLLSISRTIENQLKALQAQSRF